MAKTGDNEKSPAETSSPRRPQSDLSAVIKRARDTMRKDAGLNGDADRIPQFSWLLFLKALDAREEDRKIYDTGRTPLIEHPYRWQDWASPSEAKQRSTGQAFLTFVNDKLLPYLRLRQGTEELDVIGTIFRDVQNRMLSGSLLREVVDLIDRVDFHAASDVHTMAHVYESMLKEMRDAAGDAGEFYTPRPVIRFMVKMVNPQPGEIILDPACGTGGFLVEAYDYIRKLKLSTAQLRQLERNVRGIDKKPLPHLLATMNLLLHGVDRPYLVRDNALAHRVAEHRQNRVNVILTNPPFGGEEEKAILGYFPEGTRTTKTEWLFLQVVIERLKAGGRCAIVVPNNILFDRGIGEKVKISLLDACNLHTVIRFPMGVFAPYTPIPANILFFEKTGPTQFTWFYELTAPAGRKSYTKMKPLRDSDLIELEAWWGGHGRSGRKATPSAWRVSRSELFKSGLNLDMTSPNRVDDLVHRPPADLLADLIETEKAVLRSLEGLHSELKESGL